MSNEKKTQTRLILNENVLCYFRQLMFELSLLLRPLTARHPKIYKRINSGQISCWPAFKQSVYNWIIIIILLLLYCCVAFVVWNALLFISPYFSQFLFSFVLSFFLILLPVVLFIQNNFCKYYTYIYDRFINRFEPACVHTHTVHTFHISISKDRTSWMWLISRKE